MTVREDYNFKKWGLVGSYVLLQGYWNMNRQKGRGSLLLILLGLLLALIFSWGTYSSFTTRLVLSPEGMLIFSYGRRYFAPWESVEFEERRSRRRTYNVLAFSPLPQTRENTWFDDLIAPSSLAIEPFWPEDRFRADLDRFASNLLAGKTPPSPP